jgi:hypothetical protein
MADFFARAPGLCLSLSFSLLGSEEELEQGSLLAFADANKAHVKHNSSEF